MELTNPQTVIGRDEGDIMTMDPETSRLHAMIEIMCDGTVWLSDLGSTNGTVTNGVPVTDKAQLEDRQEFSCGKSAFMLLLDKK
jgi:pSer/pThr/pTyr-binding forkhead associated (FHA) protein